MKVSSLFAGIMGFDLGFEQEGYDVTWQVENDKFCNELLAEKRPDIKRFGDVRDFLALCIASPDEIPTADIIVGGDPCPVRSLARGDRQSRHPDLAGYFLAVVGRLRPRWVVRENVPSPDVVHFAACLEAIGYRVVAFALDARDFTSQSRRRQILVGGPGERATAFRGALSDAADGFGFSASHAEEAAPIAACATSHPARMAAEDSYVYEPVAKCATRSEGCKGRARDEEYCFEPSTYCPRARDKKGEAGIHEGGNYIFEPTTYCLQASDGIKGDIGASHNGGNFIYEPSTDAVLAQHSMSGGREHGNYLYQGGRLRVLTPEECEGLQGFPRGWTAGFSRSRRRAMLGNAICVPVARWIAARIKEAEAWKEGLK